MIEAVVLFGHFLSLAGCLAGPIAIEKADKKRRQSEMDKISADLKELDKLIDELIKS